MRVLEVSAVVAVTLSILGLLAAIAVVSYKEDVLMIEGASAAPKWSDVQTYDPQRTVDGRELQGE